MKEKRRRDGPELSSELNHPSLITRHWQQGNISKDCHSKVQISF